MLTLFALGTLWFWVLSAAIFCLITALVENESGFWATVLFVGSLASLNWWYKIPLLTTIKLNPGKALIIVGIYFLVGVIWSVVKWYFFLHKRLVRYNNIKAELLREHSAAILTPELAVELRDRLSYEDKQPVLASDHKADLTRWATYWPFSIVGTLLNDVVRVIWEYIYEILQSTYQRIADSMFKDVDDDIKLANEHRRHLR